MKLHDSRIQNTKEYLNTGACTYTDKRLVEKWMKCTISAVIRLMNTYTNNMSCVPIDINCHSFFSIKVAQNRHKCIEGEG